MVYFEIHRLYRDGFSIRQISKELAINRITVDKYLSMSEQGFGQMMGDQSDRNKVLAPYEAFVKSRLEKLREGENVYYDKETVDKINNIPKMNGDTKKSLFNVNDTYIQNFKTNLAFVKG